MSVKKTIINKKNNQLVASCLLTNTKNKMETEPNVGLMFQLKLR